MKQFCAECGKQTGEIPSIHDKDPVPWVSHGICAACAAKWKRGGGSTDPVVKASREVVSAHDAALGRDGLD